MSVPITARTDAGGLTAACDCLDRAESALAEARLQNQCNARFVYAHMAALRVAAAVLAVRARPRSLRAPRNAWSALSQVAPELAEWCDYFAATAPRRPLASTAGAAVVASDEADELVGAVEEFLAVAEGCLGLGAAVR